MAITNQKIGVINDMVNEKINSVINEKINAEEKGRKEKVAECAAFLSGIYWVQRLLKLLES